MAVELQHLVRYEFYQALRLLENGAVAGIRGRPIGFDHEPRFEVARFRGAWTFEFPANAIRSVGTRTRAPAETGAAEVTVAFMGALGACGVLPWQYSEQVAERLASRDSSLRDFIDALQHRSIAFMYRAWRKYRFPFAYESACRNGTRDDVTTLLSALVGIETPSLRERVEEGVDRWVYFAGLFARRQRTTAGLEAMLEELCGIRVAVQEFVGRWQTLVEEERSRLGGDVPDGYRNQLGGSCILGERVWDVLSGVRIRFGPVDAEHARELAPRTGRYPWLGSLIRSYLGADVDFDVVCRVRPSTVGPVRLGAGEGLGQATWLAARDPENYETDVPICSSRRTLASDT